MRRDRWLTTKDGSPCKEHGKFVCRNGMPIVYAVHGSLDMSVYLNKIKRTYVLRLDNLLRDNNDSRANTSLDRLLGTPENLPPF